MAHVTPSTPPSEAEIAPLSPRFSTPLYDPTGISSPESVPTGNTKWQSQEDSSPALPISSPADGDAWLGRRGRRRRSSELAQNGLSKEKEEVVGAGERDTKGASTAAALLWWQRPKRENEEATANDGDPPTESKHMHHSLPPLQTDEAKVAEASSSPSPSLRSPAAEFLSSMNDLLGSPPSLSASTLDHSRAYSLSPNRGNPHHSYGTSMPDASIPRQHSHHGSEGSPFGIASAAAHLYRTAQPSNSHGSLHSIRPDDEGARIGPNGRYLLGRAIGFGGFSSIREAWDLGPNAESETAQDKESLHRVAVKIIYSSEEDHREDAVVAEEELRIWETIPSHPNLLPLLHHERRAVDVENPSTNHSAISFLVMPFCEGSLLTYVKSEGSFPTPSTTTPGSVSLPRSISLQSAKGPLKQADSLSSYPSLPQEAPYFRTGSGFIPRPTNNNSRVASVPLSNLLDRSSSLANSPTSTGTSSAILRRASSRLSRNQRQTNGVPFQAARDVLKQLTEALLCLHTRAAVLHGDLKLENVLGQRSLSRQFHSSDEPDGLEDGMGGEGAETSRSSRLREQMTTREAICWRIADFGLARRVMTDGHGGKNVSQHGTGRMSEPVHPAASVEERVARNKKAKAKVGGAGGSLAYTAPEAFLPTPVSTGARSDGGVQECCSPFAADMWALGCILYALCSGKLPFSDSFEPRLQMKIAKGKWEMPNRLKRCRERTHGTAATTSAANAESRERTRSSSGSGASKSRNSSLSASLMSTKLPQAQAGPSNAWTGADMSASMPALQERRFFGSNNGGGTRSTSDTSIIVHDPHELAAEEEGGGEEEEQEQESTESDEDESIDQEMDARSKDRLEIRLALRRLLEPDPQKRWTVEQLAGLPWINGAKALPFAVMERDEDRLQVLGDHGSSGGDLPYSLEDVLQMNTRPSLAHMSISEHASQEQVTTRDEPVGRGRSKRRGETEEVAAQPIDIDRSTSRSRSRPRLTRMESSPWDLGGSFQNNVQATLHDQWKEPPAERKRDQRSSSADGHSLRERSTSSRQRRSASRPPQLDLARPPLQRGRGGHDSPGPTAPTKGNTDSASRSSTSRSRSRARDALHDIASREEGREADSAAGRQEGGGGGGDERLWWQRGRRGGR